jgi:hypothetical protein
MTSSGKPARGRLPDVLTALEAAENAFLDAFDDYGCRPLASVRVAAFDVGAPSPAWSSTGLAAVSVSLRAPLAKRLRELADLLDGGSISNPEGHE